MEEKDKTTAVVTGKPLSEFITYNHKMRKNLAVHMEYPTKKSTGRAKFMKGKSIPSYENPSQ